MPRFTDEEYIELHNRSIEKLNKMYSPDQENPKPFSSLAPAIANIASWATIITIKEYEKMLNEKENL